MSTVEHLTIVATVDKLEVGQQFASWDEVPHLTLFPPIVIPSGRWLRFDAMMHDILADTLPRFLVGGEAQVFGPPDAPVQARVLQGLDLDLRVDLENMAYDLGAEYDPTFGAYETEPHITDTSTYALGEGEIFDLDEMVVVAKDHESKMKAVKAIYRWKVNQKWRASMRQMVEEGVRRRNETAA